MATPTWFLAHSLKQLVVPDRLKDYDSTLGVSISNDGNIKEWKGYIVSSNLNDTILSHARTTYERSHRPEYEEITRTVFPGADGNDYVFIFPKRSVVSRYMGKPVYIELAE